MELTEDLRRKLVKLDFEYFLNKNIQEKSYTSEQLAQLNTAKAEELKKLQQEYDANKTQLYYYLDGQVGKALRGGMLPTLFNFNDVRDFRIMNFSDYGRNWAIFEIWKKHESKKVRKRKMWEWLTRIGAILAVLLAIFKVLEWFGIKT